MGKESGMEKSPFTSHETDVIRYLDILSQPASPFYEQNVMKAVKSICKPFLDKPSVQYYQDRFGNICVSFWNASKPHTPCLAAASHMDHPGYAIIEKDSCRLKAVINGGLPRDESLLESKALIISPDEEVSAEITGFADDEKTSIWMVSEKEMTGNCRDLFAVPLLERFLIDPPLIRGRAMDDLVGCAIQLAVLKRLVQDNIPVDYLAVFHRAEEVGLIGAQGACSHQLIPKHAVVVSLEASKTLEGAESGSGIVIRTGDKLYQFDPNAQHILESAAANISSPGFRFQKRRMDGGTCEASLYLAHGYETTALAVPLLNYHNHGNGKLEPEAVAIFDVNTGVELLYQSCVFLADYKYLPRNYAIQKFESSFNEVRKYLFLMSS
ncbi:M28 family peptidase [bacterium]|nr:M28 family peptidase [candidate division CSSED10-310 bacterium]